MHIKRVSEQKLSGYFEKTETQPVRGKKDDKNNSEKIETTARELSREFFKILTGELLKTIKFESPSEVQSDFLKSQMTDILAGHISSTATEIAEIIEKDIAKKQFG